MTIVCPRMTAEEINALARRVVTNEVFIANTIEAYQNAWMMLWAFADEALAKGLEDVGAMWEEFGGALPRSANGYPMFTSGHFVHKDDLAPLLDAIEQKRAALA